MFPCKFFVYVFSEQPSYMESNIKFNLQLVRTDKYYRLHIY